ncbi:GNAT family N-acetyltransferase [Saccharopolyspora erythraea]|uniref:GNAT family N-acetyltransferase n=1 Tax=Saccharopolyspora erythraea TaxID=1836 RepID=UPI001BA481E3|nr:GNAT family N-acetyltransferase [Saccharopolyspora erythraea]QUH02895.1 GNAT family N-acetyltransferase [Saccharopolyspora erythraea]
MEHPREELATGPVTLRRWRADDRDRLHRAVNEAIHTLRPWLPWVANGYDLDAAEQFLAHAEAGWKSGEEFDYAVTIDGAIVGGVGLMRRIGPGGVEIGYWLHPDHTGQGIITRAVAALVDEAFALPYVDHLQIRHDRANTASSGIPRRLGFTETEHRTKDPERPSQSGVEVVWERRNPDALT